MTKAPILELKNVTKRFGDKVILAEVSFAIQQNKIYGIIGKSGCGKTTLLNTIMGFLKTNDGEIIYQGKTLKKHKKSIRLNFGFASQSHSFYSKLSIKENITYFGKLYGLPLKTIKQRANILLEKFNLKRDANKLGENLSSGMKKRLDIACALIHDPEILLLDEPTADLDPVMRNEILSLIKEIREAGTTVIVTTHLLGEIEKLCDHVFLINNKQLKNVGTPEDFENLYSKQVTLKLSSENYSPVINNLLAMGIPIEKATVVGGDLVIHAKHPHYIVPHLKTYARENKDLLEFVNIEKPNLDKVFEYLIEGKLE